VTGPKLNETPVLRQGRHHRVLRADGPMARARSRYVRISAYKVRQVLDLVRGEQVERAREILRFSERDAATVVGKVLDSAVANADKNHELHDPEELFVAACYADEGPTLKRWRPRARGRATRIRKRTCHVTVIVARLPDDQLARQRERGGAAAAERRRRRAGQQAAAERQAAARRREEAGTPEEVEGADLEEAVEEGSPEGEAPAEAEPVVEAEAAEEPDTESADAEEAEET